jgi:hypothetical protein
MSPLEERLYSALSTESVEEKRAHYKLELGLYWARTGRFVEAETMRTEVRTGYGQGQSARVSILLMLLEGVLQFFQTLSSESRDRVNRANLLSSTFRERDLLALTSAWLAHIDFNLCRFESMATSLATCFTNLEFDTGSANSRMSLLLGDAYLYCGDRTESQAWYERGRLAATALGDHAAIGALTYNRAALRVANLRIEEVRRPLVASDLELLDVEVRSAVNYQAIARLQSLDHLLQFAQVGTDMLSRRFRSADAKIARLLATDADPLPTNEHALLLADRAECLHHLGKTAESEQSFIAGCSLRLDDLQPDDRALVNAALARTALLRGEDVSARDFSARAHEALREHDQMLTELRGLLAQCAGPHSRAAGS